MSKRAQELSSPTTRWRRRVWASTTDPWWKLTDTTRFWIGFAILSTLTTLLINNPLWRSTAEYIPKEGDIARESIISPADIYFVDQEETERIRQSSMETVVPIFSVEPKKSDEAVQSFRSAWESMQRRAEAAGNGNKTNSNAKPDIRWTGFGGEDLGKVFAARTFSANELDAVVRILREATSGDIYADRDLPFLSNEISIVDRQRPTEMRQARNPAAMMTSVTDAQKRLAERLAELRSFSPKEIEAFNAALSPLIQPSVVYDSVATDAQRRAVAESVQPVAIALKRGERIIQEGQKITQQMVSQIAAMMSGWPSPLTSATVIAWGGPKPPHANDRAGPNSGTRPSGSRATAAG